MTRLETPYVTDGDLIIVEAIVTGPRGSVTGRFVLDTGAALAAAAARRSVDSKAAGDEHRLLDLRPARQRQLGDDRAEPAAVGQRDVVEVQRTALRHPIRTREQHLRRQPSNRSCRRRDDALVERIDDTRSRQQ